MRERGRWFYRRKRRGNDESKFSELMGGKRGEDEYNNKRFDIVVLS